jgi:hypothetical protein
MGSKPEYFRADSPIQGVTEKGAPPVALSDPPVLVERNTMLLGQLGSRKADRD